MASQSQSQLQLHFVLVPLMAQGHMIPLMDIARLLAKRGLIVTVITTPLNALRFKSVINRDTQSGLKIHLLEIEFPCQEAGLPEGSENLDLLPSMKLMSNFFLATSLMHKPAEEAIHSLQPRANCIISDMGLPWTSNIAHNLQIPRLVFHATCCFSLLCSHNILVSNVLESVASDSEYFVVPGLPQRIELTKEQLPGAAANKKSSGLKEIRDQIIAADEGTYGIVVNSMNELEAEYVKEYKKAKDGKVWCIGPVSLCNKETKDKTERGNKGSVDEHEHQCLKWLDSQEPGSVIYASLGTLSRLKVSQLIELGLGLEQSNRPFIWVLGAKSEELERWVSEDFERRVEGRGILIRGWAPQLLILAHGAIGGFVTHCGWNSTLEGVSAGVPMVTWPLFAEQFVNEKLIVEVLRIGVSVGVEVPVKWGEEEKMEVLVKRDNVKRAIDRLMDDEGGERRRVRELGDMANKAVEEEGSSYLQLTVLIEEIMELAREREGFQNQINYAMFNRDEHH